MPERYEPTDGPKPLPPGMYEGGFEYTKEAVQLAIAHFGSQPSLTLYYPGSSSDVSLAGIEGMHTIHADSELDQEAIDGFGQLGAEAHKVDVHKWKPDKDIDVVAFINPTGIDETKVLEKVHLRKGGLAIWASWSGLPMSLKDSEDVRLVAVITPNKAVKQQIDIQDLQDYFLHKQYQDLSDDESRQFHESLYDYMNRHDLELSMTEEEMYYNLQSPENANLLFDINYKFPYKKTGTFFVFQKS